MPTFDSISKWVDKHESMLTIFLMIIMIGLTWRYVKYTLDILRESSRPEIIVYIKKLIAGNKDHYHLWFEKCRKRNSL